MDAPQGTWEVRDEPAIGGRAHFLVGRDTGMVTIQFLDFVSHIKLTPDTARKMAASLLKHADAAEGKASS